MRLSLEKARETAKAYDQAREESRQAWMGLDAAEATGDPDQIALARKKCLLWGSFENGLLTEMVKERLAATPAAQQMDMVKALCINAVLNQNSFDDILARGFQL